MLNFRPCKNFFTKHGLEFINKDTFMRFHYISIEDIDNFEVQLI